MNQAVARWCGEYLFVFTALVILKSVVFPFVLWWWFAASDLTATLQEATFLIFSVITIMILLGLGSISRYRYQLSSLQTAAAFFVINLPFVILWYLPFTQQWADWWWGVVGDGVQLWLPAITEAKGLLLFLACIVLVLAGRLVYVREDEAKPGKMRATN